MNVFRLKNFFSFVLFITFILPWSISESKDLSSELLTTGIELGNIVNQADLLHKLIESGIALYISNEGIIYYQEGNKDLVENAQKYKQLTYNQFKDKKYATLFITLLELNHIEYSVTHYCNIDNIHVNYDIKHEEKIKNEIMPKFIDATRSGININM